MSRKKDKAKLEENKADINQDQAGAVTGQLAEKDKLIEEGQNKLLRALADFDNFKKRANADKAELIKFSNELLIKEQLPIIDNFGKAIDAMQKAGVKDDMIKGLALIKKQIEDVFAKFGVAKVDSLGKPYDPHYHEAIMTKESDKEEGIVLEEMQKGYTMHGRLLRPSMVIVSKKTGGK
ncbi:nucleotide exchange factor GrpE [Candidatus Margulisiibacteriota bacterium]